MSELQRYRATVGNKASERREWVYLCVDVDEAISDAMQQAREAKLFKISLAEAVDEIVTLEAEAQEFREEIKKAQNALAFTEQWYGVRHERLWHWAHAELNEEQKRRYFNIVANGTAEHSEPPTFAQQLCRAKHRYECAEKEVSALRSRVVVVPERKLLNAGVPGLNRNSGWNACLDELARLNGLTVRASALDTLRRFATGEVGHLNKGHCPDDLEGRETRDPNCSVCRALIETEKENGNG
ncbi:hypothetical protein [Pseudomonas aeruginosa]|uniref:hypothetical protein n=1 Tax=Pseudomonas aeruginosa TaxID=287 RepID=UPI0018DF9F2B|nr:hypothetical protein [Pseudomonas aeruginosa]QPZ69388.1 hypothetical protein I9X29_17085 [Pseudomonas aeruginosa]